MDLICSTSLLLSMTAVCGSLELSGSMEALVNVPKYFEDTLQLIHGDVVFCSILFRHGDRNEIYPYGDNPEKDGMGHLVKAGRQKAYRLGLWTRARYAELFEGRTYSSGFIKVASSEVERTINSAQLFLAGFYPPDKKDIWHKNILWYPIAVYPIPPSSDNVIAMNAHCPRFNMEMDHLKDSQEMKRLYEDYDEVEFFQYIENNAKIEIPRDDAVLAVTKLYGLYDTLFVQQNLGQKHDPWVSKVYPDKLQKMQELYFRMISYNEKTKRLKAGPLTEYLIQSMVKKRDEGGKRLFQVYSGHDTTLATLMNSWGAYDGTPPPYSAALFVELRKKEENYYVTVLYRDSEDEPPRLLKLQCKYPCTLNEFIDTYSKLIPEDWEDECNDFEPDYNALLY